MEMSEGGVKLKNGKTPTDVAREYFPNLPDSELNALIWEETGFPSFWETDDVEACFREQLQDAKDRWANEILNEKIPEILIEKVDKTEQFRVWCPFCIAYHYHGAVLGHRVAHCIDVTPFTRTGYILRKRPEQ